MKAPSRLSKKRLQVLHDVKYEDLMHYTFALGHGQESDDPIDSSKTIYEHMKAYGYDMWEQALIEKAWRQLMTNTSRLYHHHF